MCHNVFYLVLISWEEFGNLYDWSSLTKILESFRKRTDTDADTDIITVSIHVSRVLDFDSQTIGMFHLIALAFIMGAFLTNKTRRDPVLYTLHVLIVLLVND